MTRIQSGFNLLKRVGFAILLWGGCVSAQTFDVLWDRSGSQDSVQFGYVITALGDQNNDEYNDWAVSAPAIWYVNPEQAYVEFFHGSNTPSTTPYHRITGADSVFSVGAVFSAGDINGDGCKDWYLHVWPERSGPGLRDDFILGGPNQDMATDYAYNIGYQDRIYAMGDFNGDGFDDLYLDRVSRTGQIFYGGDPMDLSPAWEIHGQYSAGFGDMNGDGHADVVTEPPAQAWVYFGGVNADTLPDIQITGLNNATLRIVKDLNGDGADDLLVAVAWQINVYLGGQQMSATPDLSLSLPGGCVAVTMVTAGDFNHDGQNDLIAIDPACPGASGMFGLYLGSHWLSTNPIAEVFGRGEYNLIGIEEAEALGDVNGDGIDDFAIGATNLDNDGVRGRAVVFAGDTSYHVDAGAQRPELPQYLQVSAYPNPFNASTTIKLSLPPSAQQVEMKLFNVIGQLLFQETIPVLGSEMTYAFDGRRNQPILTTGMYFLHVTAGRFQVTTKLMVLR